MKKTALLLFIFGTLLPNPADGQAHKMALLIGIGNYPAGSGWQTINAKNDIELLEKILLTDGFQVTKLTDENATKTAIVQALFHLTDLARAGNVVLVHYSGHGQQITDDNGDEFDGLDESLVPADAPVAPSTAYQGQNHLRDDELASLFTRIREKIGPAGQLFCTVDACHSGTATRGISTVRGTSKPFFTADSPPAPEPVIDPFQAFETPATPSENNRLAPLISFFATAPQELNREFRAADGRSYGPLSFALAKALATSTGGVSYQALFDKIRMEMAVSAPRQTPTSEGRLDLPVFENNEMASQKTGHAFTVASVWDEKTIRVNAGLLHGFFQQSRVSFFRNDGQLLVNGLIIEAELLHAFVELERPVAADSLLASNVRMTGQHLEYRTVRLKNRLPSGSLLAKSLDSWQKAHPGLIAETESDDYDFLLENSSDSNSALIWSKDEVLLFEHFNGDADELFDDIISPWVQANFIREIASNNAETACSFTIFEVAAAEIGGQMVVDRVISADPVSMEEGHYFVLEVENTGRTPFFFSILDIQPDNRINVIIPPSNSAKTANDFWLKPGERKRLDEIWMASPPFGTDVLKLIASDKPLLLTPFIHPRTRDLLTPPPFFQTEKVGVATRYIRVVANY